jgi:hypothetical protein
MSRAGSSLSRKAALQGRSSDQKFQHQKVEPWHNELRATLESGNGFGHHRTKLDRDAGTVFQRRTRALAGT